MILALLGMMLAVPVQAATSPTVGHAERLALARAAGFRIRGGSVVNECDAVAEMLAFDRQDLNGDGAPEVVVSDGGACYGAAGAMFVVLHRSGSAWTPVLSAQGIMTALPTRHGGWRDIEIGGPGMGRMPVARWSGSKYIY